MRNRLATHPALRFQQQVAKPRKLPVEAIPHWWHPSRAEVTSGSAPKEFIRKLNEFDPLLRVTQNQYTGQFGIWSPAPKNRNHISGQWTLLFMVNGEDLMGPLVFARLHQMSGEKWRNGKEYFDALMRESERQKEKRRKADLQDTIDHAMETFTYSQIKNIGKGSKGATYHW